MDKISDLKTIILDTLDNNKALDIVSIDLANKSSIADHMIIASGTSSRHIQALSEQVLQKLKLNGLKNCKIEGSESNDWKLIDGIDVVIHIFNPEKRKFYELEKMWSELIPKEKILLLLMEEEEDLETQGLNHLLIERLENLQKVLREKIFGYGFSLKQLLTLG